MPAGLTDEAWTMEALLSYRVPTTFTPNSTSEGSTSEFIPIKPSVAKW
jgi:hypothetical protein